MPCSKPIATRSGWIEGVGLKLHGVAMSPFVQRVLIAAQIKGVDLELVALPAGGLGSPEFAALSPMRRIPVLEEADGWTLSESSAIVGYLEDSRPGPSLLPGNARDAATVRMIDSIVDCEVTAGLRHFVVQKLFCAYSEPKLLDHGREQLARGLDAIERIGVGRAGPWLIGDRPTMADAALIPFMLLGELIALISDAGDMISGRPGIDAWWAQASATPYSIQAKEDMTRQFRTVLARKESEA